MRSLLRSSETWMALGAAVGQFLASMGIVPRETWEQMLWPAVVYVVARVTSKAVKKTF